MSAPRALRRVARTCLTPLLLASAPAHAARQEPTRCEHLFTTETQLWHAADDGPARVLAEDTEGVDLAAWSPRGLKVVYARPFRASAPELATTLVVLSRDGELLRGLPVRADTGLTAIERLGWTGERRVWVEGHVNPSVGLYLQWDVRTGRLRKQRQGTAFSPSPDGRRVAHLEHVPHGAAAWAQPRRVQVDGRTVYRVPRGTGPGWLRSALTWSSDGKRLTWVERRGGALQRVTVDVARRRVVRRAPASEADVVDTTPPQPVHTQDHGLPTQEPAALQDTRCTS